VVRVIGNKQLNLVFAVIAEAVKVRHSAKPNTVTVPVPELASKTTVSAIVGATVVWVPAPIGTAEYVPTVSKTQVVPLPDTIFPTNAPVDKT
jgi:hypothetical protein